MAPAQIDHDGSEIARSMPGRRILAGVVVAPVGYRMFLVGLVQSLAEAADAFRHIAHQIRQLAASAKQEKGHDRENEYVPDAQRTHDCLLK